MPPGDLRSKGGTGRHDALPASPAEFLRGKGGVGERGNFLQKVPPFPHKKPSDKKVGLNGTRSSGQAGVAFDEVKGAGDLAAFAAFALSTKYPAPCEHINCAVLPALPPALQGSACVTDFRPSGTRQCSQGKRYTG